LTSWFITHQFVQQRSNEVQQLLFLFFPAKQGSNTMGQKGTKLSSVEVEQLESVTRCTSQNKKKNVIVLALVVDLFRLYDSESGSATTQVLLSIFSRCTL
jgi:hypothetical protein